MKKELSLNVFKLEMEKGEKSISEEGVISSEDLKKELDIIVLKGIQQAKNKEGVSKAELLAKHEKRKRNYSEE